MFSRSKNYLSSETTPISWDIHGQSRLRLILDGTTPPSKMHWPNKHVKQMSNSRACITHARIWKRRNHETWLRPCVEIGFNSKLLHVLPRKCCTSLFRSSPIRGNFFSFLPSRKLDSFPRESLRIVRIHSMTKAREIVEPSNAIYLLSLNHLTSKDKEVENPRKKKRKEKKIVVKFNNVGRMLEEKLLEKLSVSIVVEITLTGCYINNVSLKGHSMGITSLLGNREEFKIVIGTCSFSRPYTDSRLREGTGERS